jgi:hypothetical protein
LALVCGLLCPQVFQEASVTLGFCPLDKVAVLCAVAQERVEPETRAW